MIFLVQLFIILAETKNSQADLRVYNIYTDV